jgi:hypothetical protein
MRKTMKFSGLLWALLFAAGTTSAAGLGRLSVQSALGQPLRAEIELLSVSKEELAGITASWPVLRPFARPVSSAPKSLAVFVSTWTSAPMVNPSSG